MSDRLVLFLAASLELLPTIKGSPLIMKWRIHRYTRAEFSMRPGGDEAVEMSAAR
jgi:hypothetical protein